MRSILAMSGKYNEPHCAVFLIACHPSFAKKHAIHPRLHEEITEEQTEKLRTIYLHVGRAFYRNTFEEFERRFLFFKDIEEQKSDGGWQ